MSIVTRGFLSSVNKLPTFGFFSGEATESVIWTPVPPASGSWNAQTPDDTIWTPQTPVTTIWN